MSRSRKRVPVLKDNDGAGRKRSWKRIANRAFRRAAPIEESYPVGYKPYRRVSKVDSWDIVDFRCYGDASSDHRWTMK